MHNGSLITLVIHNVRNVETLGTFMKKQDVVRYRTGPSAHKIKDLVTPLCFTWGRFFFFFLWLPDSFCQLWPLTFAMPLWQKPQNPGRGPRWNCPAGVAAVWKDGGVVLLHPRLCHGKCHWWPGVQFGVVEVLFVDIQWASGGLSKFPWKWVPLRTGWGCCVGVTGPSLPS